MTHRVLLVEDDQSIATLVAGILSWEGFDVRVVSDGRQALALLSDQPPDVVVLDYMLPHHSGLEVLEGIRADRRWAAVPVVMLTARGTAEDIKRALAAGANDYVVKPFEPDELVARIRRLLPGP